MTRTTFSVPEIVCEGCAASIRNALGDLSGVRAIEVDVLGKTVRVEFDAARTNLGAVRAQIEAAGFDAEELTEA